jgi:hypothetical protein
MVSPRQFISLSVLLLSGACGSNRTPEVDSAPVAHSVAALSAVLPGYTHDLSHSRFSIGQAVNLELNTPNLQRWRGSRGAFASDPTNGWCMALLDSGSPTGPYVLDEAAHNAAVKAYFIAAGVPADQISGVAATFQVGGGGAVGDPASAVAHLDSINSTLMRSVNGIRIAESFAGAKMTTSGNVDLESVFWPAIDMSIVTEATALAATLSSAAAKAAFFAKLPGNVSADYGVVIHHTDSSIHSTPRAFVSYDVKLASDGSASTRHFDSNGVEFRLPQEIPVAPPPGTTTRKG